MPDQTHPTERLHWISDGETPSTSGAFFERHDPATGEVLTKVAAGDAADAKAAVDAAVAAFPAWSAMTPVARGNILRKATKFLQEQKADIGALVAREGGLSPKKGVGEVDGICEHAHFWAGEGRRFYGKTTTSKTEHRLVYTVREPVGVVLAITPANTPFGGRAVMPALLAGNTVVMKPSEDMPSAPLELARALKQAGLPTGVFSVVQGLGTEAGAALVADERVDVISFTGSVTVGKAIEQAVVNRKNKFVRLSLELGGKNALVVCDDADMDAAIESAVQSAFSLAGQRCAAASRIIVLDAVYETFRASFLERVRGLKLGTGDADDLGPVVNARQRDRILEAVKNAVSSGATLLAGGNAGEGSGFSVQPTVLENVTPEAEIAQQELFGPVTVLFRAKDFADAIRLTNDSPYGLTAAIYTNNLHRAQEFAKRATVGTVHINGHTFGSEPHMPFGGRGNSGNGTREAGTEALDVYTQWKTVTITHNPAGTY